MRDNPERIMREAAATFRYYAKHPGKCADLQTGRELSDNFYVLELRSEQTRKELSRLKRSCKGPEPIPGLFKKCVGLCKKGILPSEEEIADYFRKNGGLNGEEITLLPLLITCALIDSAAHSVKSDEKTSSKQLANAIVSLRRLSETDFEFITKKLFSAEEVLLGDGVYRQMDENTKNIYRKRISALALKTGKGEKEIAEDVLRKAEKNGKHIGEYLFSAEKSAKKGYLYLIMEIVMPFAAAFSISVFMKNLLAGILIFFPLWEIFRYPIESASLRNATPRRNFRLSEDSDMVDSAKTLITVSTVMPSADRMTELEEHLEQLYLSNRAENIKICCLADFKGAGMPRKPEDKTLIKAAKEAVDSLNRKYGGGFILAVRPRVHSKTQNEFIGRERKRGAITELIRAVKGDEKGFLVLHGDNAHLSEIKYLIALDADTQLIFDSAKELISVAEHPLNRPRIKNGRVVSGYGILVPKTETSLVKEDATVFGLLMAGDSGISSYDGMSGERYRDLFSESIFCGKGLIDVDAYYTLLNKAFPGETVLSHDIVEGGYLRAGYVGEAQITEDFPKTVLSYFRRLHRWVRGDWQNIRFIFGKNPLNFISRYKIFDNLRRSVLPVICIAAIIVSLFMSRYDSVVIALCSLLALSARNLYCGFRPLLHGGFRLLVRRYYSLTMPGVLRSFLRAFTDIAFSAKEAAVCSDAIIKALWRLFVSKKKLLEWTPAAQSEGSDLKSALVSCIPSVAAAFVMIMLGYPLHRLVGLLILADIPLTLFTSSAVRHKARKISVRQREKLMSYTSAMWGFYEDLCGKENNFLPPDNIQFSPVKACADRTSPTNIGLMLTSFLAARDMGFITTAELYMRMNLSLTSIEKLEKYKGNLLNWYSTRTLQPLGPRFVSTVDSGNFLCCLTAVKEGLREYSDECSALEDIVARMEKIISDTDLNILFNERRKLFHIGIDPYTGKKSNSFYDLYMSEARMTSYFAVARREVPKKHWGALGRVIVGQGRFIGLASWTGTMFEYFMSDLFLPSPYGSLSREALYFCLRCQKKSSGRAPFGISESGFYAFDKDLNYQYKAHGVKKLALNSCQRGETVISPYSSFLTLGLAPSLSLRNLERLEKSGMCGVYGFYEAADYVKGRNGEKFSVVRSYMAHHVGMSMAAADNLLSGGCMQKRFMRDSFMKGASGLLQEKIPTDAEVFEGIKDEPIPNIREKVHGKNLISDVPSPFSPEAMILTNGRLTVCITDGGAGVSLYNGTDVTVNSGDFFNRPQGIFGVFVSGKERIPFVNALDRGSAVQYKSEFFKDRAEHTAKTADIRLKMKTSVLNRHDCELREFTVENTSRKNVLEGSLVIYFEPCIEKREAYAAHPMFSKLFLVDEWDEENGCYLFSRRSSASENTYALAADLLKGDDVKRESSREKVLKSPCGIFSLGNITDFKGKRGNPDCCCAFSVKISLEPGKKAAFTLAVCIGESKEEALDTLLTVRAGKNTKKTGANPFYSAAPEDRIAARILPLTLALPYGGGRVVIGERSNYRKEDLWSFGISGENPVIAVEVDGGEDVSAAARYIRINKKLRNCGVKSDLAIIFDGEDKYTLPVTSALKSEAEKEACGLMIGVSGGIHFVDLTQHSYAEISALKNSAVFRVKAREFNAFCPAERFRPLGFIGNTEKETAVKNPNNVKHYNFTSGKITITKTPETLDIPWCMVYANQSFGTMVSDKALGFTWYINSRENKLTPWYNDLMSDNRSELLILKYNNNLYDLVGIGEAEFTPHSAVWRGTVCGMEYTVKVSVAKKGAVKKCTVEFNNVSSSEKNFELMYYTLPVLGVRRDNIGILYAKKSGNGVVAENPFSEIPGFMYLGCSEKADYFCFSQKDFFEGRFESNGNGTDSASCVAVGKKLTLCEGASALTEFYLSAGASERSAFLMPSVADFGEIILNPQKFSTNDKALDLFCNSFLYSQVKQSRFYARTGFYQCSGAYGFRDQLQDCLVFLKTEPQKVRVHIARCAAVQFEEGDVMHWWHVTVNKKQIRRGIRTRCSDDLLWLPFACIEYVKATGDLDFLCTKIPFISGEKLADGENERYFMPRKTDYKESILGHCIRAVDKAMNFGRNGLPLIGSCDWNDGLSRIGSRNAESVWLAMFMIIVLDGMADILKSCGMEDKADEYSAAVSDLRKTVEEKAWCGDRYARIILENGNPLGGERDFIDILPQAFAVFAGLGRNGRAETALNTALEQLYNGKTVKLLSPPFEEDDKDTIGYIAAYPEGVRENGGQYTHAAVWLATALFECGRYDDGKKLLNSINPVSFYTDEKDAIRYRAEPYVLAGDVSCGGELDGRAGWTHFTGSAAWFYRCIYDYFRSDDVKNNSFTSRKSPKKTQKKRPILNNCSKS